MSKWTGNGVLENYVIRPDTIRFMVCQVFHSLIFWKEKMITDKLETVLQLETVFIFIIFIINDVLLGMDQNWFFKIGSRHCDNFYIGEIKRWTPSWTHLSSPFLRLLACGIVSRNICVPGTTQGFQGSGLSSQHRDISLHFIKAWGERRVAMCVRRKLLLFFSFAAKNGSLSFILKIGINLTPNSPQLFLSK